MTSNEFQFAEKLDSFLRGCAKISNDYREKHYPSGPVVTIDAMPGKRYVRIVRSDGPGGSRSAHCFVDQTNGDVLKAASWKAPAKHARGNIFDEHNGLGRMNQYGPEYLR